MLQVACKEYCSGRSSGKMHHTTFMRLAFQESLSVYIDHGTGNVSEVKLSDYIQTQNDLSLEA